MDHEGEVLEAVVTRRRDKKAALKLLRKLMKRHGPPRDIVTNRLPSYGAPLKALGAKDLQTMGRWPNIGAENSHLPLRRRERAVLRFRPMRCLQTFAAVHPSVSNHFNHERSLSSRDVFKARRAASLDERRPLGAA